MLRLVRCEPGCNDERARVWMPAWPWDPKVFREAWEERQLSPVTWQCLFHHQIFDIMSNVCVCVCVCVCECECVCVGLYFPASIDGAGGNKWEKETERSIWCKALQLPLSTIPNHWRQPLLKDTGRDVRPSPESPLSANHYSPCVK